MQRIYRITFRFSQITFFLSENGAKNGLKSKRLVRGGAGGKVMRENEAVLLVLSTYDEKLFLRKVKFYLRNVTDLILLICFSNAGCHGKPG